MEATPPAGLASDEEQALAEPPSLATAPDKKQVSNRDSAANHGRYGEKDYSGCAQNFVKHESLQAGDCCPDCAALDSPANLYSFPSGHLIRLTGRPLIDGTVHTIEKLRCQGCQKIFTAKVPEEIASAPKYDVSCGSNLALARYGFGVPFYRVQTWQQHLHIPMADATQWDIVNKLAVTVNPIYRHMISMASEGRGFYFDDTPNKVRFNHAKLSGRKGIYTTAIASETNGHSVILFFTGDQYGSENLLDVLRHRESDEPFFTMSDASSNNLPRGANPDLLARWVLCFCLVHGRRKFFDIFGDFEEACDFVLTQISRIYANEKFCQSQGFDPQARLAYHQQYSAPEMNALHMWLENQWQYKMAEPESGLGQAIAYMLRHWPTLTRFLSVPGVPIDNSFAERLIKIVIRHRRNSLFFRTSRGAAVGDCLMSLIHTAANSGANVYDYLNALQRYGPEVEAAPEKYLPWNYQASIATAA